MLISQDNEEKIGHFFMTKITITPSFINPYKKCWCHFVPFGKLYPMQLELEHSKQILFFVSYQTNAHRDVFQARLPWEEMVKLNKGSIFIITETHICHPKSGYVTTKRHGTSTCRRNNNAIFSDRAIFMFPTGAVSQPH